MNAIQPELKVEESAPNKQNSGLSVAHGGSQNLLEQCEQPLPVLVLVTAIATVTAPNPPSLA